jgi:3-oxoacyl-[acyl-carrier-protein] synthase III
VEVVQQAYTSWVESGAQTVGTRGRKAKKEKKEVKKRGQTEWNKFVATVWEEMKQTREKVKYSEAMTEAKKRLESTTSKAEEVSAPAVVEAVASVAEKKKSGRPKKNASE